MHEDTSQSVRFAIGIVVVVGGAAGPVRADEVLQVAADRRLDVAFALVAEHKTQDSDRDAAVVAVGRDERVEGLQLGAQRDIRVAEADLAEGIGGFETTMAEAGQAVIGNEGAARAFIIGRRDDAFQCIHGGRAVAMAGVQGEKCLFDIEALGGPIDDFPVVQVAATAKRDDAGADAAERQVRSPSGSPICRK